MKEKDEEFWERIKKWDVIDLVETWVEKEEWERWKGKVPGEFKWTIQGANKEGRRGRAKGGIWIEIRRRLEGNEGEVEEEGLMIKELKWGEKWKVGTVYIRERWGRVLGRLKGKVEEKKGEKGWILGGDFNARTGKGGALEKKEREEYQRIKE